MQPRSLGSRPSFGSSFANARREGHYKLRLNNRIMLRETSIKFMRRVIRVTMRNMGPPRFRSWIKEGQGRSWNDIKQYVVNLYVRLCIVRS